MAHLPIKSGLTSGWTLFRVTPVRGYHDPHLSHSPDVVDGPEPDTRTLGGNRPGVVVGVIGPARGLTSVGVPKPGGSGTVLLGSFPLAPPARAYASPL